MNSFIKNKKFFVTSPNTDCAVRLFERPAELSAKKASPIFSAGKTPGGVILYQLKTSHRLER
jgi:hypothetical protein